MNKNFQPVAALARQERAGHSTMPAQKAARELPRDSWPQGQPAVSPKIPVPPYDRELPPAYWQNLGGRAKAATKRSRRMAPWILSFAAFVLAAGALAWVTSASTRLNQNGYAIGSMGEPNRAPLVASRPQLPELPIRVPRRAALVKLRRPLPKSVRRAQLVDPPIGSSFLAQMPYGETVHCTFMGRVKSQANLPLVGGFIGETVAIGNQEFVWAAPAGGVAQWIDP